MRVEVKENEEMESGEGRKTSASGATVQQCPAVAYKCWRFMHAPSAIIDDRSSSSSGSGSDAG